MRNGMNPTFTGLRLASALSGLAIAQAAFAAPPAPDGALVFRQRCQSCHSAAAAKPSPLGPNLAGVVGRKAGSLTYAYSPALKASGVVWTRANLDKYLSSPAKMVPGTKMSVAISDPAQRKALIGYLATAR